MKKKQQELQNQLHESMTHEVNILREILANMEEEQEAMFRNDPALAQVILERREKLVESMSTWRHQIFACVKKMAHLSKAPPPSDEVIMEKLADFVGYENYEILALRDQIIALAHRIDRQNDFNNLLIDIKSSTSRETRYFPWQRHAPP